MKKSSFTALFLGTVSGVIFALGMCMALLPQWDSFRPGVIFGSIGLLLGLITFLIWRRMEHKAPVQFTAKAALAVLIGIAGALGLGTGMCFSMVWGRMIPGIAIGLVGILALLSLIPLVKGLK